MSGKFVQCLSCPLSLVARGAQTDSWHRPLSTVSQSVKTDRSKRAPIHSALMMSTSVVRGQAVVTLWIPLPEPSLGACSDMHLARASMKTAQPCFTPDPPLPPKQLLKGVTIAAGGVLPNIHPELLAKKRGSKGKLEAIITPPPAKKSKASPAKKSAAKKAGGRKAAGKSKVGRWGITGGGCSGIFS